MTYSKDDYLHMAGKRVRAFEVIAQKLGRDHAITKMMGALAWGRYKREWGPQPVLRDAIEAKAFLDGFFDCLNLWARDHDTSAQTTMLSVYPTNWERRP